MAKPLGLTVKALQAVAPRATTYEVRDPAVTGGYVRVWPSGALSYVVRYRFHGAKKLVSIGKFDPATSGGLASARAKALAAVADLHAARDPNSGTLLDPAAAKRRAHGERAASLRKAANPVADAESVEGAVESFLSRHVAGQRSAYEARRLFAHDVLPAWRGRRLRDIGKADVHALLDRIVDRGSPIAANRVFSRLRKLFRWSLARGMIDVDPTVGLTRPAQERARDRVLDDAELRLVWRASQKLAYPFGRIVLLLILSGQRKSEIAGGRWSEINLKSQTWSLPSERVKNKRAHTCPLSPQATAIIKALPRVEGSDFLFTTTGSTSVSGFSRAKRTLDAEITRLNNGVELPDWTLHDLRRSCASGLARIGVDLVVIERALNHVSGSFGGIVSVYQHHKFEAQMRTALDAWGRHIERVVAGDSDEEANVFGFAGPAR